MRRSTRISLAILMSIFGAVGASNAEIPDGTKQLACDLTVAAQCDGVAQCKSVTAEQIDLPPTLLVDLDAGRISSEDGQRTSPITSRESADGVLVLQGHQTGRAWTMVIERATGHLSATLADVEGAFVLGGACTTE